MIFYRKDRIYLTPLSGCRMKFKHAVLLNPCVQSELWTDGTINKMIVLVHLMNVLTAANDLSIFVLKKASAHCDVGWCLQEFDM